MVNLDRVVEQTFMAPRNINLLTIQHLGKSEFHYSIMHTFGFINSGYQHFWGIDDGANIRLSFEYGVSDDFSMGIGRSSFDKIVDVYFRYHPIKQKMDDSMPVSLSFSGGLGINTSELGYIEQLGLEGYSISDRANFYFSTLIARKFNDLFSLQLSPTVVYFNRTGNEIRVEDPNQQLYLSTGVSSRYKVTQRSAVTLQFIPAISGERSNHNFAIGYDIETGGHVFQLFFTTSQALNDSYLIAGENGQLSEREFRFGFNINRLFQLGR
ncbi:MAG TPA: hypothetical protein DCE78_06010 [Bacteroidetes bacterium]|nr:hypothetical protein [Bacteroidota bacterium]